MPEEDVAPLDLMLLSYQKAVGRFQGGGDRPKLLNPLIQLHRREPDRFDDPFDHAVHAGDLYAALGDAIRWARAIDSRFCKQLGLEHDWWKSVDNGPLVPAARYVRNAVEHDWSQALNFHGIDNLTRADVREVRWASVDASRRNGRVQYEEHMLGQRVLITLLALNVVLWEGALLAED